MGVIDDHEVFRRGVVACLSEDSTLVVIDLTASAAENNTADAMDAVAAIDVVVTSSDATRVDALACPTVVCCSQDCDAAMIEAHPNVLAVLPRRTVTPEQLTASVHAAAAGLHVNVESTPERSISDRSRDVLRMLAAGADTREISGKLGYSERTIKAAISEIQTVLGTRNRTHAVAEAVRANLI